MAKVVSVLALIVLAVSWLMGVTRNRWASATLDSAHSYAVQFRGGTILYFAPIAGWFLDNSLWIFGVLLALVVTIELVTRREVGRGV